MKYTCQPTENSLDELGIPKNPYFDPSHVSVASFCLISEGGHSMPPPYRSFHFSIPTDTGLNIVVCSFSNQVFDDIKQVALVEMLCPLSFILNITVIGVHEVDKQPTIDKTCTPGLLQSTT